MSLQGWSLCCLPGIHLQATLSGSSPLSGLHVDPQLSEPPVGPQILLTLLSLWFFCHNICLSPQQGEGLIF